MQKHINIRKNIIVSSKIGWYLPVVNKPTITVSIVITITIIIAKKSTFRVVIVKNTYAYYYATCVSVLPTRENMEQFAPTS